MNMNNHRDAKRATIACWIAASAILQYQAIAVLLPARPLDKAWHARMNQVCEQMKPKCESVGFRRTTVRDFWHGVQVNARAAPGRAKEVQAALTAAVGVAAKNYVTVAVVQRNGRKKTNT